MIAVLLSIPRLKASAIIAVFPYVYKRFLQKENLQKFTFENLRLIAKNTAKFSQGEFYKVTYDEIFGAVKEDPRSAEEIAADIIKRAGLVMRE